MSTIRLDAGTAEYIAAKHDEASTTIEGAAATLPTPDAGLGGPEIAAILAALTGTAGTLAGINRLVAAQLRDIGSNYARTEDDVAGMFSRMDKALG